MSTDERFLALLKAVARGPLYCDDIHEGDEDYCLYCNLRVWHDTDPGEEAQTHESDCPVTLARQMLKEQDMPVWVYCVSWRELWQSYQWQLAQWVLRKKYVYAFSEQDALEQSGIKETTDENTWPKRRTISAWPEREAE